MRGPSGKEVVTEGARVPGNADHCPDAEDGRQRRKLPQSGVEGTTHAESNGEHSEHPLTVVGCVRRGLQAEAEIVQPAEPASGGPAGWQVSDNGGERSPSDRPDERSCRRESEDDEQCPPADR